MFDTLPAATADFLALDWPQIEPYFADLQTRPLNAETLDRWMADYAALGKLLDESYWSLWVATTQDTRDTEAEARFLHFLSAVQEPTQAAEYHLRVKLLASTLTPRQFAAPLRNLKAEVALFSQSNLPLLTEEHRLSGEYDQIRAAQTVHWNGKETTLVQLGMEYTSPDRAIREKAWCLGMERSLEDRASLNDLWARLFALRQHIAANADLPNYRDYRWQQMLRLDYTPDDCATFHRSIETVVVPAVERVHQRRKARLGLDSMRPWDVEVAFADAPPRPFTSVEELETRTAALLAQLDPALADYFAIMQRENLLDLANRPGKMPSSYCATYPVQKRPFLFMNVVGTHEDVMTLFHELGHAFHSFESTHLPYHDQLEIGTEFHEVAAITMELLAAPYMAQAGFYDPQQAARARVEHLENMLRFWPYIAVVDAFQHWAHSHPDRAADPANCDAAWADLWVRFMDYEDWSGLDDALRTGWQRKLHIFQSPFYYIDYGLAQLGAVQIWANARADLSAALERYRAALALGGTVPLPHLFAVAGARLAFDADTFAEAVEIIETTMAELEIE